MQKIFFGFLSEKTCRRTEHVQYYQVNNEIILN